MNVHETLRFLIEMHSSIANACKSNLEEAGTRDEMNASQGALLQSLKNVECLKWLADIAPSLEWRPIETAPTDDSIICGYDNRTGREHSIQWEEHGWCEVAAYGHRGVMFFPHHKGWITYWRPRQKADPVFLNRYGIREPYWNCDFGTSSQKEGTK